MINTIIIRSVAYAGLGLAGFGLVAGITSVAGATGPDANAEFYGGEYAQDEPSMLQSDFPCEEDSALMYHPAFGPDHVGCVHLDALV